MTAFQWEQIENPLKAVRFMNYRNSLQKSKKAISHKIQNIVFEIHQIPSYKKRATKLSRVLKDAGYLIHRHGPIVYASRD